MPEPSEPRTFDKPMWLLWSWGRGDALPLCSAVPDLTIEESTHVELLSHHLLLIFIYAYLSCSIFLYIHKLQLTYKLIIRILMCREQDRTRKQRIRVTILVFP